MSWCWHKMASHQTTETVCATLHLACSPDQQWEYEGSVSGNVHKDLLFFLSLLIFLWGAFFPVLSGTGCSTDHPHYVNYRLLGSWLDEILLRRWLYIVGSCQCSCYMLLRSSHRALSCASQIIFHKWIVCTEHLLPCAYSDRKRMELCQFFCEIQGKAWIFWMIVPSFS